jgi:hypothetical protein
MLESHIQFAVKSVFEGSDSLPLVQSVVAPDFYSMIHPGLESQPPIEACTGLALTLGDGYHHCGIQGSRQTLICAPFSTR